MLCLSSGDWITQVLAFVGGCFGLCAQPIISVEDPSNGMGMRKSSISEGFWSSMHDLENTIKPQKSMSFITISNPSPGECSGSSSSSTSSQEEFVNQGYLRWKQSRLQWRGCKKPESRRLVWEPIQDWDASYECIVEINEPFPCPVPLSEVIDLLVDIWEDDGLYE